MKKYLGKGVYGAVAIGKISVFKKCDAAVTRIHVEDTEKEKRQRSLPQNSLPKFTKKHSERSEKLTHRYSRFI